MLQLALCPTAIELKKHRLILRLPEASIEIRCSINSHALEFFLELRNLFLLLLALAHPFNNPSLRLTPNLRLPLLPMFTLSTTSIFPIPPLPLILLPRHDVLKLAPQRFDGAELVSYRDDFF